MRARLLLLCLVTLVAACKKDESTPSGCVPDADVSDLSCEAKHCLLAYRFSAPAPTGSRYRIEPIAAAATVDIGPGLMIVRVPRDASGKAASGVAELLYYEMDQFFTTTSGVTSEGRVCLLSPGTATPVVNPAASPPEQEAQPGCLPVTNSLAMATGTFALGSTAGTGTLTFGCYDPPPQDPAYAPAMATGTAPGCMQTWFRYGRIFCTGTQLCSYGVSPTDTWLDRSSAWSQHFIAPISLSSNLTSLTMGDPNGGATPSAWAHMPNDDNGWTGFALVGTLDTALSTCEP